VPPAPTVIEYVLSVLNVSFASAEAPPPDVPADVLKPPAPPPPPPFELAEIPPAAPPPATIKKSVVILFLLPERKPKPLAASTANLDISDIN
jgi:hypothetical protein